MTVQLRGADKLVTGVRNQRGPGIGNQRNGLPRGQPAQKARACGSRIVVMIGGECSADLIAVGELARDAGVLAGDQVRGCQSLEGTQRDIAEVADRRRHEIEAAREGGRLDCMLGNRIGPASVTLGPCFSVPWHGVPPYIGGLRSRAGTCYSTPNHSEPRCRVAVLMCSGSGYGVRGRGKIRRATAARKA